MIVNPEIERYLEQLLPPREPVLAEMEEYARRHRIPIVGPLVGRLLAQLVQISSAKRIFELGSAIGYSTLWLASAAGPLAEIHYTDASLENARLARQFFERAGAAQIRIHTGDALECLARTPGEFDFIFNDVDKEGYPAVLEAVGKKLRLGGLFVTDNTLWRGQVLTPQDATTRAVDQFNRLLHKSLKFWTVTLPIRDGVTVSRRIL